MSWRQFVMSLDDVDADRIEAALQDNGALAVTFSEGAADAPVLEPARGETPLWSDTIVTALFDDSIEHEPLISNLKAALGTDQLPANRFETLKDRAWEREWLADFKAMKFGKRLWVLPGDAAEPPAGDVFVRLDPGLAFGTGTHATTALCLQWLDGLALDGARVLDFGCGSGILGVAALKLGARSVLGVDNDPQALTASEQNAGRNGVGSGIQLNDHLPLCANDDDQRFDVIIANVLAAPLIDHAEPLVSALRAGGKIALSGILPEQASTVAEAYAHAHAHGIDFDAPAIESNWVRLSGVKR